jgi:hypothetical protein
MRTRFFGVLALGLVMSTGVGCGGDDSAEVAGTGGSSGTGGKDGGTGGHAGMGGGTGGHAGTGGAGTGGGTDASTGGAGGGADAAADTTQDASSDASDDVSSDVSGDATADSTSGDGSTGTGGSSGTGGSDAGVTNDAAPEAASDVVVDNYVPSCKGTATVCTARTSQQCTTGSGCQPTDECSGSYTCSQFTGDAGATACAAAPGCIWTGGACSATVDGGLLDGGGGTLSCSAINTSKTCSDIGCTWTPACAGTPHVCTYYTTSSPCNSAGCSWNGGSGCSGTPPACDTHSVSQSCEIAGCSWTSCSGTAVPCTGLDETACGTQLGCSWQ